VRVTSDALRQLRGGHPWIYDGSITDVSHEGVAGDLAVVFDRRRAFAGIGLYDPASAIRVKVLHAGRPTAIDRVWFHRRLQQAYDRRAPFWSAPDGDRQAFRMVNGENDGFPGLVVDRYASVLVLKLYSEAWTPWIALLAPLLLEVAGASGLVVRTSRQLTTGPLAGADGDVLAGTVPEGPVEFREDGLRFEADVRRGQKTGHFLDQRANRRRVGGIASGAEVLDVFAATGGFSVHAAAGGASRVVSIDSSRPTLEAARRNMELNRHRPEVAACRHETRVGDAFDELAGSGRAAESFDVVVVDPPSFARRRSQVTGALGAYRRLTELAAPLVRPGGMLVQASCSSRVDAEAFHDTVAAALAATGRTATLVERTGHDLDHPVSFPEGEYLKAGFWRLG
jgi:23S rRNA (cytosine1962-C5)-methyltransferase